MTDYKVRAARALEENAELAQVIGVSEGQAIKIIRTVYRRPVGDVYQEIGGSLVTLLALCRSMNIDPNHALEVEINRCLAKSPEHFAARNEEKLKLGLTGHD